MINDDIISSCNTKNNNFKISIKTRGDAVRDITKHSSGEYRDTIKQSAQSMTIPSGLYSQLSSSIRHTAHQVSLLKMLDHDKQSEFIDTPAHKSPSLYWSATPSHPKVG